jgi:hypothetical protein
MKKWTGDTRNGKKREESDRQRDREMDKKRDRNKE